MLNNFYCSACSNELIFTGSSHYSIIESYYICPTCNTEYIVTKEDEATLIIQAELKGDNNPNV